MSLIILDTSSACPIDVRRDSAATAREERAWAVEGTGWSQRWSFGFVFFLLGHLHFGRHGLVTKMVFCICFFLVLGPWKARVGHKHVILPCFFVLVFCVFLVICALEGMVWSK